MGGFLNFGNAKCLNLQAAPIPLRGAKNTAQFIDFIDVFFRWGNALNRTPCHTTFGS